MCPLVPVSQGQLFPSHSPPVPDARRMAHPLTVTSREHTQLRVTRRERFSHLIGHGPRCLSQATRVPRYATPEPSTPSLVPRSRPAESALPERVSPAVVALSMVTPIEGIALLSVLQDTVRAAPGPSIGASPEVRTQHLPPRQCLLLFLPTITTFDFGKAFVPSRVPDGDRPQRS